MGPRSRAALVQLAAFLGGGVVAPVWHLAGHRPNHTHGPGESTVAVRTAGADHDPEVPRSPSAAEAAGTRRGHSHPDGAPALVHGHRPGYAHRHTHAQPPAHESEEERPAEGAAPRPAPRSDHGPRTSSVPIPLEHGHGSLAHLGLALLGAPPAIPVPEPEPTPDRVVVSRLAALRLFQPAFPRPRPPPPVA